MAATKRQTAIAAAIEAFHKHGGSALANTTAEGRTVDQALDTAARDAIAMLRLIQTLDGVTPVEDVTLGGKEEAAEETRSLLGGNAYQTRLVQDSLEVITGRWVQRSRALGLPWQEIGSRLGVSAQGIYKKARAKRWVDEWDDELEVE